MGENKESDSAEKKIKKDAGEVLDKRKSGGSNVKESFPAGSEAEKTKSKEGELEEILEELFLESSPMPGILITTMSAKVSPQLIEKSFLRNRQKEGAEDSSPVMQDEAEIEEEYENEVSYSSNARSFEESRGNLDLKPYENLNREYVQVEEVEGREFVTDGEAIRLSKRAESFFITDGEAQEQLSKRKSLLTDGEAQDFRKVEKKEEKEEIPYEVPYG